MHHETAPIFIFIIFVPFQDRHPLFCYTMRRERQKGTDQQGSPHPADDGIGTRTAARCASICTDLRFREVENRSILDAILERRLAEVVRLLVSTRYSITRISLVCGFKNPKHLKRLFKSRYGATMRDFRNARGET